MQDFARSFEPAIIPPPGRRAGDGSLDRRPPDRAADPALRHEAQREFYLPRMVRAEAFFAIGMSEQAVPGRAAQALERDDAPASPALMQTLAYLTQIKPADDEIDGLVRSGVVCCFAGGKPAGDHPPLLALRDDQKGYS